MSTNNASALVKILEMFGTKSAFGICGGFIVPLWEALESSKLKVFHCTHEGGAASAASECSLSENRIAVSFSTAGPGFYNTIIGLKAAKLDCSKVVHLAAITTDKHDGKWGLQETTIHNVEVFMDTEGDGIFDDVIVVENREDFDRVVTFLEEKYDDPRGFVLGVFMKSGVQEKECENFQALEEEVAGYLRQREDISYPQIPIPKNFYELATQVAADIEHGRTIVWNGFGTRYASKLLYQLVEATHARVMSTPRGKGIFPETHPLYIGSTGLGSDSEKIKKALGDESVDTVLIMGTRLGELSSSYAQKEIKPTTKCYYIGLEVDKVKNNLPPQTQALEIEIGYFLRQVLSHLYGEKKFLAEENCIPQDILPPMGEIFLKHDRRPDPKDVMEILQEIVIDRYECQIVSEAGNSFAWTNRYLKIKNADGYRVSTGFGAMAHYSSGIIGLAAFGRQVVGVIGDGSFLMTNEVATAVKYDLPAIWLIMHDGYYNMCRQGLQKLGVRPLDCWITPADFSVYARSLGADGYRVMNLMELEMSLLKALDSKRPTVIDVLIDADSMSPSNDRIDRIKEITENNE